MIKIKKKINLRENMKTISELLKESLGAEVQSNFQIVLTEKFDLTADEVRDSKKLAYTYRTISFS